MHMLVSVRLQVSMCTISIDIAQTNTHAYIMYAHKERNKKKTTASKNLLYDLLNCYAKSHTISTWCLKDYNLLAVHIVP